MAKISDTEIRFRTLVSEMDLFRGQASKNETMLRCLELAQIACKSSAPVIITGESGVGKTLIANAIHYNSPKRALPCVTLNCATVRDRDIRTRLFGGGTAAAGEEGLIRRAAGGTLIIDSVDQLPGFVQKELLSILVDRLRPESGDTDLSPALGARLISTSGSELSHKTNQGLFVEDLMYCLGEITIRVPALRERREDLPDLAAAAIREANLRHGKRVKGLSRTASDFIRHYDFPGNVRELFLIINRAVREISRDIIYFEDMGLMVENTVQDPHLRTDMTMLPLWELEKRHINKALLRTGWKKGAAAKILGISETMLTRKIRLYGLERGSRAE